MTLVRWAALAVLVLAAGCSNKPSEERAHTGTPTASVPTPVPPVQPATPTRPANAGASTATGLPADFHRDCVGYAELIDKLKACDQLGGARDGFTQAYLDVKAAWSTVPADRREQVAQQCRTQADSLRNAAAATCRW